MSDFTPEEVKVLREVIDQHRGWDSCLGRFILIFLIMGATLGFLSFLVVAFLTRWE